MKATRKDIVNAYDLGWRDFSGLDLSGVNLGYLVLEDINLSHCNLVNASFVGCCLHGAVFKDSALDLTDFTDALFDDEVDTQFWSGEYRMGYEN